MDQIARSAKQIGVALRRRRRALSLTQNELARQASLRQATVSSAESGKPMQVETLVDLLTALDLEIVIRTRSKGRGRIGDIF